MPLLIPNIYSAASSKCVSYQLSHFPRCIFRKGRGNRHQIANICWIIKKKKQEKSRNSSTSASLTMLEPLTMWITTNWKILKEMGISDHLTCLLRNLFAGQEATVRSRHGTTDWFKIGKGACQGYIFTNIQDCRRKQSK